MATKVIAGKTVQVNDEGFMTNPAEWTKEMAPEIAKEEGIAELTADHWKVIDFCRETRPRVSAASRPRCARSPPAPASRPRICSHCSRRARPRRSRTSRGWANRKGVFEFGNRETSRLGNKETR